MLNNGSKIALSLLGATMPLLAQADQPMSQNQSQMYQSGEPITTGQLPAGYNASADYNCNNGWDIYLTGDYIFWDWVQDSGMTLGARVPGITSTSDIDLEPSRITPGYASGFQIGLGCNIDQLDGWNFYGEYTWYKNSGSKSFSASATTTSPSISFDFDLDGDISLKYSNADFLVQRPFYFGKKLTANFYTGLKALWITNKTNVNLTNTGTFTILSSAFLDGTITDFSLNDKLSSWALGPKFGLDSNWLLGYGFKFLSNLSLSVVYTRYTERLEVETAGNASVITIDVPLASDVDVKVKNYGTVRPILETFLGLGWGSFFCDDNFHFDLSVGYDFNVHWNYITNLGGSVPPTGLYLHGLNVQARFDF